MVRLHVGLISQQASAHYEIRNIIVFFKRAQTYVYRIERSTGNESIDIESLQNRLHNVGYVPTTSTGLPRLLLFAVAINSTNKQTRQVVCTIKKPILRRCL